MHSKTYFYPKGQRELLVKKEWDESDQWLDEEQDRLENAQQQ